jgi:hypothetical protein
LRPRGCENLLRGLEHDTEGTRYTMSEIARNFLLRESPLACGTGVPGYGYCSLVRGYKLQSHDNKRNARCRT